MDIRDLDYFLACCEAGSFTAAARSAHIVQSAMSSAIARLERDLEVPLFDRGSTPITLTEHGLALQGAAFRILDAVQAARDEVAAVSGHVRGTVTLGCTLNTGPLDLAAVLSCIRDRYPDVIIKLRQHSTGSAGNLQALRDGSVDIALYAVAGNAPADEPPRGIVLHHLVSEAIVFVCRPDHPLAGQDRVTVADLRHERLLRFPPGWGVRTIVDNALGATQSAVEIVDYGLMTSLVRAGFGTALVPTKGVEGERGAGLRVIPVDDPRMRWNLAAAISADRRLTAATRTLLDALIKGAAEARQQAPPSLYRSNIELRSLSCRGGARRQWPDLAGRRLRRAQPHPGPDGPGGRGPGRHPARLANRGVRRLVRSPWPGVGGRRCPVRRTPPHPSCRPAR